MQHIVVTVYLRGELNLNKKVHESNIHHKSHWCSCKLAVHIMQRVYNISYEYTLTKKETRSGICYCEVCKVLDKAFNLTSILK